MKPSAGWIIVALVVGLSWYSGSDVLADDEVPFVSMSELQFAVDSVFKVESVLSERQAVLKSSKRSSQLVEVKLVGVAPRDGQIGLYPSAFSLVMNWRDVPGIYPSMAFGRKRKLLEGIEEYWLHLPEASMLLGFSAGERIVIYALFEVPKDATGFQIQIPTMVSAATHSPLK